VASTTRRPSDQATVTAKLAALASISAVRHAALRFHEWDEPELWRRPMALLANNVAPRLK